MKKSLVTIFTVVALTGGVNVQADADIAAGQAKSMACLACHGMGGNSLNPMWPKLAGQHPSYIKSQLEAYKKGARKDPIMAPMAMGLDAKAIDDLAAYYLTVKRTAGVADPKKAALGKKIYFEGIPAKNVLACSSCHGADGYGNPGAGFPNIASQQSLYMTKAMKDYRSKTRTTDPGAMMRNVTNKMTDAEIDIVTQFAAGLRP